MVQQATQIAIKATQEEKREYLKNGLLNSFDSDLGYEIDSIFVNLVDELTVFHVKALKTIQEHKLYLGTVKDIQNLHQIFSTGEKYGTSKSHHFIPAINPPQVTQLMYVVNDLKNKNLLYVSDAFKDSNNDVHEVTLRATEDKISGWQKPYLKVSDLGEQFLKFIAKDEPEDREPTKEKAPLRI